MLENNDGDLEDKIKKKSEFLWNNYKYQNDEKDRVILSVCLEAKKENKKVFSSTYQLDEQGFGENTAMAKLVSITLSAAIDLIIENKIKPGVQAAPSNRDNIEYFFDILKKQNVIIQKN